MDAPRFSTRRGAGLGGWSQLTSDAGELARLSRLSVFLLLSMLLIGCASGKNILTSLSTPVPEGQGRIVVDVYGFRNNQGSAIICLYSTGSSFPAVSAADSRCVVSLFQNRRAMVVFDGIPFGLYAVSVLHDEDGDGEMTRSWIGKAKEGAGTSRNHSGDLDNPSFRDACFVLCSSERRLSIGVSY